MNNPPSISPVANLFFAYWRNQKLGHMGQVVYGTPKVVLAVLVRHVCVHGCRRVPVDPESGHEVGYWCGRPTPESGLRNCDICEKQYIDPNKYQDPRYETNCPACVKRYGLDDD